MTRIGILALQGDVREHADAVTALGATPTRVRTPDDLAAVDGLILPGGESTTISRLLVTLDLFDPLRARLAAGMPAYGSCAGMILLADQVLDTRPDAVSLGAIDMTVRRNAFGRQVDSFETDLPIDDIGGDPMRTVFIRAPWVERVGPSVRVLGRVSTGEPESHVVAVRQGNVVATSFHPEVTGDHRMHEYFLRIVAEAQ